MMHKKYLLSALLLTFSFGIAALHAETYKVLFANSNHIKVGKHYIKKGDVINEKDKILWSSEREALKVVSLSSGRIVVLPAKELQRNDSKSISDFFRKTKRLSTRSFRIMPPTASDSTYYLLDTLLLRASKALRPDEKVQALIHLNDETITTPLSITSDGRQFILTPNIYGGRMPIPAPVDIVISESDSEWRHYAYRKLHIVPLPLYIDEKR